MIFFRTVLWLLSALLVLEGTLRSALFAVVPCLVLFLSGCGPNDGPHLEADASSDTPAANKNPGRFSSDLIGRATLKNEDILKALDQLDSYKPVDQFSPSFDDGGLGGKPIEMTFSVKDGHSARYDEPGPRWYYDADKQVLEVTLNTQELLGADRGTTGRSFALGRVDVPGEEHEAQNAFGAKVDVSEHTEFEVGIVEEHEAIEGLPSEYSWKMKLPPEQARLASGRFSVQIRGAVSGGAQHPFKCQEDTTWPTFDNPDKVVHHVCSVLVRIDSVQLLGVPAGVPVTDPDPRSAKEKRDHIEQTRFIEGMGRESRRRDAGEAARAAADKGAEAQ